MHTAPLLLTHRSTDISRNRDAHRPRAVLSGTGAASPRAAPVKARDERWKTHRYSSLYVYRAITVRDITNRTLFQIDYVRCHIPRLVSYTIPKRLTTPYNRCRPGQRCRSTYASGFALLMVACSHFNYYVLVHGYKPPTPVLSAQRSCLRGAGHEGVTCLS